MSHLHRAGIQPRKHILDNEISQATKDLIHNKYHMQYQLAPPGCHQRNAVEYLSRIANDFPLQLWDKLLPQTEITLNLLRQSNATTTISAYANLCGPFDYNKMSLAPLGCNVEIHEKSDQRGTWAFHSVDSWYISTSPEHYCTRIAATSNPQTANKWALSSANETHQFIDYLASQDDAVLTYNASKMILGVHSNASYLSQPNARGRAGGHSFLSTNASVPPNNGAILNIAHIIKHVMASATEAELGALYITARRQQPATPIQTDNAMAEGVINGKVQPKSTKAMDMCFHWLRERKCQDQFRFYWQP
eukprot:CCRYP_018186-RA/>CCRYP_018186-RA protein AED:0.33 eAED:0.32 QI:0/0/0/1/0/0/4/0/305